MANRENESKETNLEKREAALPEGVERTREGREFLPAADIFEANDRVVLTADMPGVSADRVDITLERNVLTISGEVGADAPENLPLVYREYDVGRFVRSFTLSSEVDRDGIEARMRNGVLTLTLPKVGPTRKTIDVKGD